MKTFWNPCYLLLIPLALFSACRRDDPDFRHNHIAPQQDTIRKSGRMDIPLHLIYEPYNRSEVTVYAVIYINGHPVRVAFDTGSSGLRMISGALAGAHLTNFNEAATYGYGNYTPADQTLISGTVAGGFVSFSPLGPGKTIRLMLIKNITVDSNATVSYTDSVKFAGAFRNMNGLMGVGMRLGDTTGIASPLAQLTKNGQFLVLLPHYGKNDTVGHLILNPDAADLSGFKTIQLNRESILLPNFYNSYNDAGLPGILSINGKSYYGKALLDCGNPLVWTDSLTTTFTKSYLVPAQQHVSMEIASTTTFADTTFTVSPGQLSGQDEVEVIPVTSAKPNKLSFGIQFFLEYDVFFDEAKGLIGIRKKN